MKTFFRTLIIVGLLMTAIARIATTVWVYHEPSDGRTEPPPEFEIVTNAATGLYGAKWKRHENLVIETSILGRPLRSRQAAIDRAWSQIEFERREQTNQWGRVK